MQSSRMRTARLLPASPSMHCAGGVSAPGGVCSGGCVSQYALRQTPPEQNDWHNLRILRLRAVKKQDLNLVGQFLDPPVDNVTLRTMITSQKVRVYSKFRKSHKKAFQCSRMRSAHLATVRGGLHRVSAGWVPPPWTYPPHPRHTYPLWKETGTRDIHRSPGKGMGPGILTLFPCGRNDWQTPVKTLPSRNFIGARQVSTLTWSLPMPTQFLDPPR